MRTWFMSLDGAVALSVITLLTFLARTFGLDAMFVLPNELGVREDQLVTVALLMLGEMAVFGGWILALLAAVRGRRGGVIAALILSLSTALFSLYSVLVFCAGKGCAVWPVGNITLWAAVITGLAASLALGRQLGRVTSGRANPATATLRRV